MELSDYKDAFDKAAKAVKTCKTMNQGGQGDENAYSEAGINYMMANNAVEGNVYMIIPKRKYR